MFSLFLSVMQRNFGEVSRLDQEDVTENFFHFLSLALSLSVKLLALCSRTASWEINEGNRTKRKKKGKREKK
jgi:hypothetical protein